MRFVPHRILQGLAAFGPERWPLSAGIRSEIIGAGAAGSWIFSQDQGFQAVPGVDGSGCGSAHPGTDDDDVKVRFSGRRLTAAGGFGNERTDLDFFPRLSVIEFSDGEYIVFTAGVSR